jgi:hypothetical protein
MTRAISEYLSRSEHDVTVYHSNAPFPAKLRCLARLLRSRAAPEKAAQIAAKSRRLARLLRSRAASEKAAHIAQIAARVREAKFDIVIGIENGEVFLERLPGCKKVFFANAPCAHEVYFSRASANEPFELEDIRQLQDRELAIFASVDLLTFAWNTHVAYTREHLYDGKNLVPHPGLGWFGCTPRQTVSDYWYPPSFVFLGWMERYWVNMELLSILSSSVPYVLDTYGPQAPRPERKLRYKGVALDERVVCKYKFGVSTASREPLRQWGFASKVLTYLEYGLPSFSPEWQRFSHQLRGVIPYAPESYASLVEEYSEKGKWDSTSRACLEQAAELSWESVLKPLVLLLESL